MRTIADIVPFVLAIVLAGLIVGTSVLVLDKFMATDGLDAQTTGALNDTIGAITPITSSWLPLLITVGVIALVLALIVGAFSFRQGR